MVKVFIFGITGFIGLPTALALRRNGHIVYGLVRTAEKAKLLAQNELIPVIGAVEDTEVWAKVLREKDINVVLELTSIGPGSLQVLETVKQIGAARLTSSLPLGKGPKLGFVQFSGTWVHGDHNLLRDHTNELSPVGGDGEGYKGVDLIAWRPAVEQQVLAAGDVLDSVVVRPAMLFGGQGSIFQILFAGLFKAAQTGEASVEILGGKPVDMPMVHKDDIADFNVKLVEKISLIAAISYPVFDIISFHESYLRVVESLAQHIGYKGQIKYRKPANAFEAAILTNYYSSSDRARSYLGWEPKHRSIVAQMDVYGDAMAAHST